jgi:hypothetical protein
VSAEDPDLLVTGERVALGPLRPDLAETYGRWMNQPEVRFGVEYLAIATPQSQEEWIEESNKAAAKREPESVTFTTWSIARRSAPAACSRSPTCRAARTSASRSASAAARVSAARRRG